MRSDPPLQAKTFAHLVATGQGETGHVGFENLPVAERLGFLASAESQSDAGIVSEIPVCRKCVTNEVRSTLQVGAGRGVGESEIARVLLKGPRDRADGLHRIFFPPVAKLPDPAAAERNTRKHAETEVGLKSRAIRK